jgi:hypothetical protein
VTSAPDLSDPRAWEINGSSLTAWISDTEILEITPETSGNDFVLDGHRLTLNDITTAGSQNLGWFSRITTAQRIAAEYAARK